MRCEDIRRLALVDAGPRGAGVLHRRQADGGAQSARLFRHLAVDHRIDAELLAGLARSVCAAARVSADVLPEICNRSTCARESVIWSASSMPMSRFNPVAPRVSNGNTRSRVTGGGASPSAGPRRRKVSPALTTRATPTQPATRMHVISSSNHSSVVALEWRHAQTWRGGTRRRSAQTFLRHPYSRARAGGIGTRV